MNKYIQYFSWINTVILQQAYPKRCHFPQNNLLTQCTHITLVKERRIFMDENSAILGQFIRKIGVQAPPQWSKNKTDDRRVWAYNENLTQFLGKNTSGPFFCSYTVYYSTSLWGHMYIIFYFKCRLTCIAYIYQCNCDSD